MNNQENSQFQMIERGDQNGANSDDPITTISKEDLNIGVPKILTIQENSFCKTLECKKKQ